MWQLLVHLNLFFIFNACQTHFYKILVDSSHPLFSKLTSIVILISENLSNAMLYSIWRDPVLRKRPTIVFHILLHFIALHDFIPLDIEVKVT